MEHTDGSDTNYTCVVCRRRVHGGVSECPCSTYRKEAFQYATICSECAEVFDRLMSEEFKPVLNALLNKKYWEGVGPVIDF